MFLVAFPAIYRSVTGWCKRYFGFLTTICTGCLVHFSWSAKTSAASSASEAASSIVAHIYFSVYLSCLKSCNRELSQDLFNFYLDMVSDFCPGYKNYKSLYPCDSISFSGYALDCYIVNSACQDWSVFILSVIKQFFPSVLLFNQPIRSTQRGDVPELYKLPNKLTDTTLLQLLYI